MDNIYRTRDLSEAAALLICKKHFIQIQREGKVCWFVFEDLEECKQISNEFFFGELIVNARDYYQIITKLKNRIFAKG